MSALRTTGWARVRSGPAPVILYGLLALLSFPTAGTILRGTAGWTYLVDVLDDGGGLPRLGMAVREWGSYGPTLWNPYVTAGNAFLGQFALPPLSPDVALAFLVGPFAAFAISIWLTSLLAGVGMHLFLRDSIGLATPAVVVGSVIAVFCYWHPIYGVSVAILPLILWLGDRGLAEGRTWPNRYAAGLIVAATLALYAGQVQVMCIVAALQLAWLVAIRGARGRRLATWAGSWIAAFALFGPVLATQLAALPGSERSIWDMAYLIGAAPGQAVATIVDHYSSILVGIPFVRGTSPSDPRYGTLFLGGVGLVLAVVGAVAGRRDRATNALVVLLIAIPLLDLVTILATPLQNGLPIIGSFQFIRIRHFFPFALAGVAAIGIDALVAGRVANMARGRQRLLTVAAAIVLVPVAVQAAIAARAAVLRLPGIDLGDPRDVGWALAAGGLGLGLLGGLVLVSLLVRPRWAIAPIAVIAVVILLAGDRILLANGAPLLGSGISTFDESLALTPGQAFLLAQPGISGQRVLTFNDNVNRMAFQGLLQADGYQAIYPLTYHGFFGTMTAPGLAADPAKSDYFHRWGARAYAFNGLVDPELVALAGIRWLYVHAAERPSIPDLVTRFQSGDVTVYEDPDAFPRAFVVGSVEHLTDTTAVLGQMAAASLDDLRGRAFLSGSDAAPTGLTEAPPGSAGSATIAIDEPDRIEVRVQADRAGMLVLTDVMVSGWTAAVDDVPATIVTTDATFRGVALSAGSHTVVFRYRPTATYLGFAVAALAAILVVLGGALAWRRRRVVEAPAAQPGDERGSTGDGPAELTAP